MKNIWTQNLYSDDEDDHLCEFEPPTAQKYFEVDELLNRYEPIQEISRGTNSIVYSGKVLKTCGKLETGMNVALKKTRAVFNSQTNAKRVLTELRTLRKLRKHNNIIKLYDIIPPKEPKTFASLTLVFEGAATDLHTTMRTNQFFTTSHVQYILYQILLGIKYMHSAKIVHNNLKPANILINEDCCIKICDFAEATTFQSFDYGGPEIEKKELLFSGFMRRIRFELDANVTIPVDIIEVCKKWYKRMFIKKLRKTKRILKRSRRCSSRRVEGWYKSPEIMLREVKSASASAVDMFAIGAIFGELLQMERGNRPDPGRRSAIFYPEWSFMRDQSNVIDTDYASVTNEMMVIFNVIGTPNETEIAKIKNKNARKYLCALQPKKRRILRRMFPGADNHALDLLNKLLKFDVDERITSDGALQHKYLRATRNASVQKIKKCTEMTELQFHSTVIRRKQYRELMLEEVIKYNKYDKDRLMQLKCHITRK